MHVHPCRAGSAPELPVVTIVYDFEVPCSDCPVVIVEPDAVPSKYKVRQA